MALDNTWEDKSAAGMTLRDYFAAAALTGLLSNTDLDLKKPEAKFAGCAYEFADAMLKEREK